jgi:hypothetical protein
MFEAVAVVDGYRITALNRGANMTSTQMPNDSGDLVTYLGDAAKVPVTNPVGGVILYSDAGVAKIRQSDGTVVAIANSGSSSPIIYSQVTHTSPHGNPGAATTFDFDTTPYPDSVLFIKVHILAVSKGGGASLTTSAYLFGMAVVNNKNGIASFGSAQSGAANPMQTPTQTITLAPQTCDSGFLSGGFSPMTAVLTCVGGVSPLFQCTVTNVNNTNDADTTVTFEVLRKAA